ncbi:ABC transporter permease, partial [Sinorhizobium meliloti]
MPTMVAETARSKENRTPGVWTRLLHRPLALIGLAVIIVVVGAAALAPWV